MDDGVGRYIAPELPPDDPVEVGRYLDAFKRSRWLIVGIVLASVARHWPVKVLWLLWPLWVWFAVMATGNHFWLDVFAGVVLGAIALAIIYRRQVRSFFAR